MKRLASLSLDLDNKWSYLKTRGVASWRELPSYLDVVVPRLLQFLKQRGLRITVLVVGQDAALDRHRELLGAIAADGHEIGNHSFHHEPWLHLYPEAQLEEELGRAEEQIERATGKRPIGFRGPGFTLSASTLRVLARRGYRYDASTLPTFLGPLARAYYFFQSSLDDEQREKRKALFGTLRDGLRPLRPYRWDVDGTPIVEIPVTTMPLLRVPIHVSYVLYLSVLSPALGLAYFRSALALIERSGVEPSLLLHPLDFLGAEDDADLSFFPAMGMPRARKLEVLDAVLRLYSERFDVATLERHAAAIAPRPGLKVVPPGFAEPRG
jgi:peptidoglycan/xylan/chitin deacetylase (PgdA/CDA1 family)